MRNLLLCLGFFLSPILIASDSEPELIGGRPAQKAEFPEIIYISSGSARCTATIVSDQVIITAAHCVKDSGTIEPVFADVDFVIDQVVYKAFCKQAPLYRDEIEDHDMAICKTDKKLTVKPASIGLKKPLIGQKVLLTGYGCINPDIGTGGNDGILRVGVSIVTKLPSGRNHWFYAEDDAALCFGDSGGPAMVSETGIGKHQIIGVNSRGNIKDLSLLTALFTPASIKFMTDFAKAYSVKICGVTHGCFNEANSSEDHYTQRLPYYGD